MIAQPPTEGQVDVSVAIWTVRLGTSEQITVGASSLYSFTDALPGLPASRRFALIRDDAYAPLHWLQSLDEWEICLPVLPLAAFHLGGYSAAVASAAGLGEEDVADQEIMLVTHLGERSVSVNLLAPVLLDRGSAMGRQIILDATADQACWDGEQDGHPPERLTSHVSGTSYPLRQQVIWDPSTRTFGLAC